MKPILPFLALIVLSLAACNSSDKKDEKKPGGAGGKDKKPPSKVEAFLVTPTTLAQDNRHLF
jgi:hypothetical protein